MSEKIKEEESIKWVLKGVVFSVLFSLLSILIFALILKVCYLGSGAVKGVNQFIKVLSVFIGVMCSVSGEKGFIKGGVIGIIYSLIIYFIFALIGGEFLLGKAFLLDFVFSLVVGTVCGIIAVNIKSKRSV